MVNTPSLQMKDMLSSPRKMAQSHINVIFSLSAQFSNVWLEMERINYWFPHSSTSFYFNYFLAFCLGKSKVILSHTPGTVNKGTFGHLSFV